MTEELKDIEQQLNEYMETIKVKKLPAASIDDVLYSRLDKEKHESRRKQKWEIGGLTAAVLLIGFMLLVNFSSTFQRITANVPVLSDLVKLVKLTEGDQGLEDAIKHGYVQPIHVKDTQSGVTFEVTNIVVDHSRLVVFYNASTNDKRTFVDGETKIRLTNSVGKPLDKGIEFDTYKLSGKTKGSGKIDFILKQNVPLTRTVHFKMDLSIKDGNDTTLLTFNMAIPINQKLINDKKTYSINKWMNIKGQKIYIKDVVIYPTQTVVNIRFDKANSMKILQLPDIHIEDQNGKTFAQSHVGSLENDQWMMYLANIQYAQPKKPVLVIGKLMAIDKNQSKVMVNIHDRKLIAAPKGIMLKTVTEKAGIYELHFTMGTVKDFNSDFISGDVKDASGKKLNINQCITTWHGNVADTTIEISKKEYQEPLSFEVSGYPNYLHANIRVPLTK